MLWLFFGYTYVPSQADIGLSLVGTDCCWATTIVDTTAVRHAAITMSHLFVRAGHLSIQDTPQRGRYCNLSDKSEESVAEEIVLFCPKQKT